MDKWYKCEDKESFLYARRLIKEEGLLCGEWTCCVHMYIGRVNKHLIEEFLTSFLKYMQVLIIHVHLVSI